MNGYNLAKDWFDFKFENKTKVRAIHTDMFMYIVDHWNRLGQKEQFGLPTSITMEMLSIGSYNTYKKTLKDLIDFGFVILISESKNQHQSKIIAISKNDKATDKALDKARYIATDKAIDSIDKLLNTKTIKLLNNHFESVNLNLEKWILSESKLPATTDQLFKENSFIEFWNLYDKKASLKYCKKKFYKLSKEVIQKILQVVPMYVKSTPEKKFRKNPSTWINQECWNDEIIINNNQIKNQNNETVRQMSAAVRNHNPSIKY
jgi:hypothetical protein